MKVSRQQLKEIIRKVYKRDIMKEGFYEEEIKTKLSNALSNFFSKENNLEIESTGDGSFIVRVDENKMRDVLKSGGFFIDEQYNNYFELSISESDNSEFEEDLNTDYSDYSHRTIYR